MEVEEMKIGKDGLDTKFELNGEEIKLTKLSSIEELNEAHSNMVAIVCEEFFEMAKMYADEKGIELNQVFESKKRLEDSFQNYLSDFMERLVDNAAICANANWELFKRQRENPDNNDKHYDA